MRQVLPLLLALSLLGCGLLDRASTLLTRRDAMEPEELTWSLQHMTELFPSRTVSRDGPIHDLPRAAATLEGLRFERDGETVGLDAFFEHNHSQGMVVLHRGKLVFERYAEGADPTTRFTSWSVAKSFTSTLVGLAVADGLIQSLDDRLERYIPDLDGSAYDGVTIRQALQMSSGVKFVELYTEGGSDVYDFMTSTLFTNQKRANDVAKSFASGAAPGTLFNYSTAETQILGWLVQSATGRSPAHYLQEKIWRRLGMEHDAAWLLDREGADGMEMAGCCLNMALRDWARFGQLMLQDGVWEGERILPAGWVAEATRPAAEHLAPGKLYPGSPWGYQYQWWALPGGVFAAQGVYGQFIYVDPEHELVVAKASAWPDAWVDPLDAEVRAAFAAMAEQLDERR